MVGFHVVEGVTVIKMLESLPEAAQEQAVDHLRQYLADLKDDQEWEASFKNTEAGLIAAARRARLEIAQGQAQPMDYGRL